MVFQRILYYYLLLINNYPKYPNYHKIGYIL